MIAIDWSNRKWRVPEKVARTDLDLILPLGTTALAQLVVVRGRAEGNSTNVQSAGILGGIVGAELANWIEHMLWRS